MSEPEAVVERAVERLRPLYKAASLSWWDANVSATEENEQRRVEAELALSDALADADLFGDVLDHHRPKMLDAIGQESRLPPHDRVANAVDRLTSLLDVA